MIRYEVSHVTRYDYQSTVQVGQNELHLRPRTLPHQKVTQVELTIVPEPNQWEQRLDPFGNLVDYFSIEQPHQSLEVTCCSQIELDPTALPTPDLQLRCESVQSMLQTLKPTATQAIPLDVLDMGLNSTYVLIGDDLAAYGRALFPPDRPFHEALTHLNRQIYEQFSYDPGYTTIATPVLEVLQSKRGVCQDFAHLMIAILRSLGYSARYVSGYIENQPQTATEQLTGADASHAWLAVYIPGSSWCEYDPTNGKCPTDQHLTVAIGRDYADVTPLKGVVVGGGASHLTVQVTVRRLRS